MIQLRAGSATDVGLVRSENQDNLLVAHPLFAVADGMGGAAAGGVASKIAIETLESDFATGAELDPDRLIRAAQSANRAVWEKAEANPEMRGMGTTLVAIAQIDGDQLAVINIGDSRLYAFRDGELRQVTLDHNLVAELVALGRISPEEAEFHPRRNIMTRALGVDPDVPVDLFMEEARPGDRYLLCSDGLPRELKDDLIASLLRRLGDPSEAARELVEEAKRRGGNDNITVVVVDVVDVPDSDGDAGSPPDPDPTLMTAAVDTDPGRVPEVPAAATRRRFARRPATSPRPKARLITPRVVGFLFLFVVIVGAAAAGVVWYARDSYFVGVRANQIVIYKGRPGGVLWFKPTVADVTPRTTSDVLPARVAGLKAGVEEPSLIAAQGYVNRLVAEMIAATPTTTTSTSTTTTTTLPPPTTTAAPPTTLAKKATPGAATATTQPAHSAA